MVGHFSAQKTHSATSRSLWVLSPCVLTRGIILLNKYSSSSLAIRPLLAQRSMERDLSQETRELTGPTSLVAVTKDVQSLGLAAIRQRVEEIEAGLLLHMMRHEMRMTLGISPLHQPRPIYKATDCPERTCKNCTWFSQLTTLGWPRSAPRKSASIDFSANAELQLAREGSTRVEPIDSFRTADLHPAILCNVKLAGYDMPTPIQRYCIPATVLWQESVRGLR
ncbi:hypothetical protein NEUTE1DRAFT_111200 [Neurospora tetrasperma FGSC 2508]|uniref:DEAD-box RNA helicase Q domain-containing protein n=1 Tax=Neurospora tetrasperma (strain FGSC 2508 / ATCC MYA-4615 / P0657) TaxID=510951 RepID=F8MQY5_NEUT8|nr:uncharacterized protein NEUTE1DRAFT_111200 [Neurospora tetrasperma FGSC 2508]EGO56765.1 hypothetical protein NEUTE1DRAFT_111200 [Neurospora tetrasperma FGSC 2508]EGZ70349.1 hypothetical protein NEUTE2DRAFT_139850 [Neurospora tetrasperma FGSC 2509]